MGSYDVVELRGLIGSQVFLEAGDWHCGDLDSYVIKVICLIGLVIHIFWYVDDVEDMDYDDACNVQYCLNESASFYLLIIHQLARCYIFL